MLLRGARTGGSGESGLGGSEVAKVFAALGDPTRLKLLRYVLHEEHCVSRCIEHVGLSQGAVSKQLTALARAGVLVRRRVNRRTYYRVADPEVLERMLTDAESVLPLEAE
jgi:DNA-binding transcriptional ArsR family regulator